MVPGSGFTVWESGFREQDLGFWDQGSGFWSSVFGEQDSGIGVQRAGVRVYWRRRGWELEFGWKLARRGIPGGSKRLPRGGGGGSLGTQGDPERTTGSHWGATGGTLKRPK